MRNTLLFWSRKVTLVYMMVTDTDFPLGFIYIFDLGGQLLRRLERSNKLHS
jgi:hypothetical protein